MLMSILQACFLFGFASSAASSGVTIIRTAAQYNTEPKFIAPANSTTDKVVGLCIDIHRAIERIDHSLKFIGDQDLQPAARVEALVMSGSLDVACGLSRTPLREAKLIFIDPPLFSVNYYLAVTMDDPITISNWDDVRGLGKAGTILVSHGFGPADRLRKMQELYVDTGGIDAATNLRKLMAKRGRFYYHRSPGIEAEIRRYGLEGQVKILPNVMDTRFFYMTLGPSVSFITAIKLQSALNTLADRGDLSAILRKWFSSVYAE